MGTFLCFFLSNLDTLCCQRRCRSVGCVRYSVGGLRGPMYCPCGFTPRRDRCRLFTTDPKGRQGYVSCDKGGGLHHFEERSCSSPFFILVLAVFLFSLPATIFQLAVGLRFQFFFCVCFPFSFVLYFRLFVPLLPFIFFFSLLSLPFVFFLSLYFEFTGRALGYRYRDPPRQFSLYRRPSADGLEGPTMPGRESSIMFAVFSRVGVTCSDGRPSFHVCFIFFYFLLSILSS